MPGMTQQQMPTIQLCRAFQEGNVGLRLYDSLVLFSLQYSEDSGISTVSRTDHSIAQTRELVCTKIVVPQVVARGK